MSRISPSTSCKLSARHIASLQYGSLIRILRPSIADKNAKVPKIRLPGLLPDVWISFVMKSRKSFSCVFSNLVQNPFNNLHPHITITSTSYSIHTYEGYTETTSHDNSNRVELIWKVRFQQELMYLHVCWRRPFFAIRNMLNRISYHHFDIQTIPSTFFEVQCTGCGLRQTLSTVLSWMMEEGALCLIETCVRNRIHQCFLWLQHQM